MIGFLSLGSNQGDKKRNLEQALEYLGDTSDLKLKKISGFYETEPWGGVEQDSFLNLVVELESMMEPLKLLHKCQQIEEKLGRTRSVRWGPRTIDIDILIYNNKTIKTPELILPHPYLEEREFVLAPLREIEPKLLLPSGKMAWEVKGKGKVKKISFLEDDYTL
jgi:2-amino-4-hydroxy-6-hydroxymethyldihydropteridine diphosphokinase